MKCIYVFQVTDPETGFHICDPEEIHDWIDRGCYDHGEWSWRWDEL